MKLRNLDLCAGIGGFSLGLERAHLEGAEYDGFETVAFCEIEEFPRKVLAKHWPGVPCYNDLRELTAARLAADGIAVEIVAAGFPCQDISFAGKGAGLAGERSGLFYEIARLVGELGPRFVILENVGALLHRGLDAVLGTLASLGYDAEWHCIPASYVGAPHRRDRVWILAYPAILQRDGGKLHREHSQSEISELGNGGGSARQRCEEGGLHGERGEERIACGGEVLADTPSGRRQGQGQPVNTGHQAPIIQGQAIDAVNGGVGDIWRTEPDVGRVADGVPDALDGGLNAQELDKNESILSFRNGQDQCREAMGAGWQSEPETPRVANGVPDRAHRLRALGNAVVPQIPELIGNAILHALHDPGSDVTRHEGERG